MISIVDADLLIYRIGYASNDVGGKYAIRMMADFLEDMVYNHLNADYVEGFLTGSDNYRHAIAKTAPYKGTRKGEKPVHYDLLREYLRDAWMFPIVEGQEADDAVGIRAYQLRDEGEDYIICSLDKDLDMIEGWHYNFAKDLRYEIKADEALRNFYKQILTGDRVDNIPGLKGIGPKKADKILGDAKTEQELFTAVLAAYEGDILRMTEMGQLLWIRRKENELWQPPAIPSEK